MIAARAYIEERAIPVPHAGCWLWLLSTNGTGYGQANYKGRIHLVHRLSYQAYKGPIPAGMLIQHSCDTPLCVNPDHLYAGTLKDNARDTLLMGRAKFPDNRGEKAKWAKLTAEDAKTIFSLKDKESAAKLAKKYGVCRGNIHNIWTKRSWRSVTND